MSKARKPNTPARRPWRSVLAVGVTLAVVMWARSMSVAAVCPGGLRNSRTPAWKLSGSVAFR